MSDSTRLPDLSVEQLQTYLSSTGWTSDGEIRKVASVWHREDSRDAEVILPLSVSVKDFRRRLLDALNAVADHEVRTAYDVAADVMRVLANVITVRVMGPDTTEGTIPLDDGVLLFSKARDMLSAAALSLYAKRKQFSGQVPKGAKAYLDSLLLGQTEVGSYVVNVIAPVESLPQALEEGPLAGAVTLNLVSGLQALSEASTMYVLGADLTVFETTVAAGASANLCDALLGFSGKDRKRGFEIRVTGASGPMFEGEARTFSFGAVHVESLAKASGYFKDDYVLPERQLWGSVKKLARPHGDDVGTVTLVATVSGVERSVAIRLGPDDYHQAVLAHDKGLLVQCRGDVHVKSRSAELLNPTGFSVVEERDLF